MYWIWVLVVHRPYWMQWHCLMAERGLGVISILSPINSIQTTTLIFELPGALHALAYA